MNTNDVKLVKPKNSDQKDVEEFKNEFFSSGENNIPGSTSLPEFDSYQKWLKNTRLFEKRQTVPVEGFVPATQYLLRRKSDGRLIGMLSIRHELNDHLKNFGGNFGGSIRPSERNHGYSAKMLQLGIKKAKKLGLSRVLVTCLDTNHASAKSIQKAGGIFENKKNKLDKLQSRDILVKIFPLLASTEFEVENLNALLAKYAEHKEMKIGKLMWPVRIAVTAHTVTPGGAGEMLYLLEKEESLKRIQASIDALNIDLGEPLIDMEEQPIDENEIELMKYLSKDTK